MTQLALDSNNHDLIKGNGNARIDQGRYTIQLVECKLKTLRGEWDIDPSIGWINFDDHDRNYDLFALELSATRIILSCQGVQSVDSMTLTVVDRKLLLQFTASTIYGGISLTIPW